MTDYGYDGDDCNDDDDYDDYGDFSKRIYAKGTGSPRSLTGLHLYSLEKASSIWADSADLWVHRGADSADGI